MRESHAAVRRERDRVAYIKNFSALEEAQKSEKRRRRHARMHVEVSPKVQAS